MAVNVHSPPRAGVGNVAESRLRTRRWRRRSSLGWMLRARGRLLNQLGCVEDGSPRVLHEFYEFSVPSVNLARAWHLWDVMRFRACALRQRACGADPSRQSAVGVVVVQAARHDESLRNEINDDLCARCSADGAAHHASDGDNVRVA